MLKKLGWMWCLCLLAAQCLASQAIAEVRVPVLVYHRFSETVIDSMTVRTSTFESNLQTLKQGGYTVIPLRQLVAWLTGKGPAPAPKSVVITVDDGHRSVYEQMLPLVERYKVPVTLFIYPSAISNASYAMTWDQLDSLKKTGRFDIQGHTYWHPNFKREKRRLDPSAYREFVDWQLVHSKQKLDKHFGINIDQLAWPFGIYDDGLMQQAAAAGYVAAFTLDARPAGKTDKMLALPRYLIVESNAGPAFAKMLASATKAQ